MSTTLLQFGFLLFVALGNLCLGFTIAWKLGWGTSLPPAVQRLWKAAKACWQRRQGGAGEAADHSGEETRRTEAKSEAAGEVNPASTGGDNSTSAGEAVRVLIEENRETLVKIVADLLEAGETLTPAELQAAAAQTNSVGQRVQQRLNSAADLFRQQAGGEETTALLEGLWETINSALVGLFLLDFDQESLADPIRQLTEAIQTIAGASQHATAKLEELSAATAA